LRGVVYLVVNTIKLSFIILIIYANTWYIL